MIASRLARALKRQDWVSVAVELALVTLGVLIALQIGDWSQSRADKRSLGQTLERLDEETATNLEIIDFYLARYASSAEASAPARVAIEACDPSPEAVDLVVASIAGMAADFDPSFVMRTADELTRQDRFLDQLSLNFRAAFNRFQARLDEDDAQTTVNFTLLWDNHVINHPAVSAELNPDPLTAPLMLSETIDTLCEDTAFRRRFFITSAFIAGLDARLTALRTETLAFRDALDAEREAQR